MDVLGVNNVMNTKKQAKRSKKPLKVVYISTPMKVQTSASNFRDLVQELTGRDSDTARFMELSGDYAGDHDQEPRNNYLPDQQQQLIRTTPDDDEAAYKFPLSMSYTELLQPYSEASFNSFSHEHLQLGVLRSFNPVLIGINKYPSKVIHKDSSKKTANKSCIEAFVELVNYQHLMSTRYTLDVDLKDIISVESFQSRDKKVTFAKETKKRLEERFKSGKNRWFFTKLRF